MKWLWDPAADADLSRTDEELTAAGHTATPGGRLALRIILLVYAALWVFGGWVLLKAETTKHPTNLGYAAAELKDHQDSDGEPASP